MTTDEKVELALIPVVGLTVRIFAHAFPTKMGVGTLVLWASALLLFQSLVRDVWLLRKAKQAAQTVPVRKLSCMCIESTAGVTGVIIGMVLLGVGLDKSLGLDRWVWSLLATMSMIIGFLIKDYVFEWNPWRIRRDRDHLSIVFTWKK